MVSGGTSSVRGFVAMTRLTHNRITFAPVRAKFVRITETDAVEGGPNWSMSNLRIYEAGPGK
jgi:hypothetical protein